MRSMTCLQIVFMTVLCFNLPAAHAQTKDAPKDAAKSVPASEPAVATTPERTTASFADWILRCERPLQQKRVCEVAQIVSVQGQANPIAQIALGRAAPTEAVRLTVVLPTNVAIPAKPQIVTSKEGGVSSELAWQSCTAAGCFASSEISEATIVAFAAQVEAGRLLFKDATGREIALPVSFRGLSQAVAALAKEM